MSFGATIALLTVRFAERLRSSPRRLRTRGSNGPKSQRCPRVCGHSPARSGSWRMRSYRPTSRSCRGKGGEPLISPHLRTLRPFLSRGDFQPGLWGHALVDELAPADLAVEKIAYSAFYMTRLEWLLRKLGIDELYACTRIERRLGRRPRKLRAPAFRSRLFELGEDLLDRIEVGGSISAEHQTHPGVADRPSHGLCLVRADIVEDHDVARLEGGREELFDIGVEAFAVDRPEQAGRLDAITTQGRQESRGLPVAMGNLVHEPFALRRPAAQTVMLVFGIGRRAPRRSPLKLQISRPMTASSE